MTGKRNMGTITKTIRMPEDLASWLSEQGDNMNQAIVDSLCNQRLCRVYSLSELKGRFSAKEWKFFADSLNGTLVNDQFRYNKGALIAHCEDSESIERTATKWGVDINTLKENICTLAGAQVEALYSRVERFWLNPVDLDTWAEY